jgi:prenyltransferase beta subunit
VKLRNAISGKYQTIIVVMLMGLLLIAATAKKEEAVELDFKKTSAYIHEMDARPDFPDTIIFARDYVYSIQALEEKIAPKVKEKIIDFTKKIQRSDGGVSIDPAAKEANSLYTDFAVETLSYLDAVNSIDSGKIKSYLSSLQRPDGGFAFNATTKESSLQTTYFAIHVLSYLGGLNIVDKAKTAAYIKGFEKKDTGGFTYMKGTGVSNVKNTYMGVFTLKTLGMLDEQTKKNAIKYLTSTMYIGKPVPYEVYQTLAEQAYSIITLKMLGAENRINKDGVVTFIKGFYLPLIGGFAPKHGNAASPDPTYFALRSLAEMGILKKPLETRLQ